MLNTTVDTLADKVMVEVESYYKDSKGQIRDAINKTAKQTAQFIKGEAKKIFKGHEYADSWTYKAVPKGKIDELTATVYSKPPFYRLAHLLEKGHAKSNGGRVIGRPHIKPGEDYAAEMLIKNVSEALNK